MASRGTLVVKFIGDLREFEKSTKSLSGKIKGVGKSLTTGLTLPLAAVGASMLKMAGDFESGMNRVAALSGATGQQLDDMREQAKELGSTTQFSASQAADAMGFLAMAGFETNEIMGAMPATLQLAAAGQLELADAADIASNILTGFGMEASELTRANDVLAKTFTSTNTDLTMLGEAFKMVGPVAKSAGLSFEETSAAIGLLGNAGIQATMAGTSLRGAITRLINPTKQQAEVINELGLNVLDAQGNIRPLVDIISQLEESGAGTAEIMSLFGQRAGPAMASLVSQGSGALRDLTGELRNSGGTAQEIADTQMKGFNGAMLELKSAWEGLMIAFGESGALEDVTGLLEKVTDALQSMADTNPELLKVILAVAAFAAVIGPLLIVISALINAFATIIPVVAAVGSVFAGIALGPALLIIAAIVAIGATVFLLIKHWDTIKRVTIKVWNAVKSAVMTAVNAVVGAAVGAWNAVRGATIAVWNAVSGAISSAWNFIKGLVSSAASAVVNFLRSAWNRAKSLVSSAWNAISNAVSNGVSRMIGFVRSIPGKILSALGNLGSLLFNAGKNIIRGLIDGIKSMIGAVGSAIGSVASKVRNALPFSPAKEGPLSGRGSPDLAGRAIVTMLAEGIRGRIRAISAAAHELAAAVASAMAPRRSPMQRAAAEMLQHLRSGGGIFEDFSFRGMSDLAGRFNDQLTQRFATANPDFDFGQPGTRAALEQFLTRQSQPTQGAMGGQGAVVRLEFNSGGEGLDDLLVEVLRRSIRVQGGDAQVVLGS